MDICHLKNAELKQKLQKYKGRVVLRGDIVKDDSGAYALFTEQGSSSLQKSAAKKKMDVVAILPHCDGQAADAVFACTKVKLEEAPTLSKFLSQIVQTEGHVFHDMNGHHSGQTLKIPWRFWNELSLDWCGKDISKKFFLKKKFFNLDGRKYPIGKHVRSSKNKGHLCQF